MSRYGKLFVLVAVCIGFVITAQPSSALNTPQENWLTTIGNACFNNGEGGETCRTSLYTRTEFSQRSDNQTTIYFNGSLEGPNGPLFVSPKLDAWSNREPVADYEGFVLISSHYGIGQPTQPLPAGIYTYTVSINYPKQWVCSKFDANGCSYRGGEFYSHTYVFDFDGTSTITVPPIWAGKSLKVKQSTDWLAPKKYGDKQVMFRFDSNANPGSKVSLQQRVSKNEFKTIGTGKIFARNTPFGSTTVYSKGAPRKGAQFYRVLIETTGGDTVTRPLKLVGK